MILVLGSTGMLGSVVMATATERGLEVRGVASREVNFEEPHRLEDYVRTLKPGLIINCAGLVDLVRCETDPCEAYVINAQVVGRLVAVGVRLIQVSTDHYWAGDLRHKHAEYALPRLLNEYARTKYAGEKFALTNSRNLVVRTNIVGYRNTGWMVNRILADQQVTLFEDFYTSPIDVWSFAAALLDLPATTCGVLNVAGSDVVSKKEFGLLIGAAMNKKVISKRGSVTSLTPKRADSLGLDSSRAEKLLGRSLPTAKGVANVLAARYLETERLMVS